MWILTLNYSYRYLIIPTCNFKTTCKKTYTEEALLCEIGDVWSAVCRRVAATRGPSLPVEVGVGGEGGLRAARLNVCGRPGQVVDRVGPAVLHLEQ
jgi:hypothetical protein